VGMSMAQIGEFAFIVATLGLSLGVISDFLFPVAVGASVITTFSTPYMIRYSDLVYMKLDALLPQSWKNALNKYSIGAQTIEDASDWKKLIRFYFINTIVFSVVIITLIILCTEYLSPMFAGNQWGQAITAGTTLILLSPFLYALAFRRTQKEAYANIWMKPFQRGPLIILLLTRIALAIFYVGFLFHRLFSPGVAVIGVCVATLLLFIFWKRIKLFYSKIELRFLSNLNEREEQQQSLEAVPLAPWDAHISTIQLNPESKYAGQTLQESKIREEFGVNIAMIERGSITIRVPGRDERLFPGDTLSVIGTDEQLNTFKDYLESTVSDMELIAVKQSVSLQHFTIGKNSGLLKKSIRESGIRELTKGLVVGVERKGERILNPESDLVFEVNDIVWVVGNEKRIQVLSKESQTE
jgi:CPA2 family monovalent cation:H+ antiporter-2